MGYERHVASSLLRLALLVWFAQGCRFCPHSEGTTMSVDVREIPTHPRYVTIAVRSWTGSSQSIVAASFDLLDGTGQFEARSSMILWFEDPERAGDYFVVGAYTARTSASIFQLQDALHGIEGHLNDGQSPRIGGHLVAELLWVEGVRISTSTITLPNPSILATPWALNAFMATTEDPLASTCRSSPEDLAFCRAVDKEFRSSRVPQVFETPPDMWVGGEFANGKLRAWGHGHARDEELLAVAFDALLAADAARGLLEADPRMDTYGLFKRANRMNVRRRANEVVPVESSSCSGTIENRAKVWLQAASSQSLQRSIIAKRAVVFELGPSGVRGAILGIHAGDKEAPALVPVESVEVSEGGGAPREPRVWSVKLRVPSPPADQRR